MHYIIGTYFTVDQPRFQMGMRKDTSFGLPAGNTYQLVHIAKQKENLEYHFVDTNRQRYVLQFKTARDADAFISKHKKEQIPNYDSAEINSDNY